MKGALQEDRYLDESNAGAGKRRITLKRVLENGRYLVLFGVIASFIASAGAFIWGAYKTVALFVEVVATNGDSEVATPGLIATMDKFLIAAGLYIFAVAMYELFIGDLDLPPWLEVRNIHEVKILLSNIIILVLAITFLEHVIEWSDPQAILQIGIGIAVVIAALIAFNALGEKH